MLVGAVALPLGVLLSFLWGVIQVPRLSAGGRVERNLPPVERWLLVFLFAVGLILTYVGVVFALSHNVNFNTRWRWVTWVGLVTTTTAVLYGWWLNAPTPPSAPENPAAPPPPPASDAKTPPAPDTRASSAAPAAPAAVDPLPRQPAPEPPPANQPRRAVGGSRITRYIANNVEPLFAWVMAYPHLPLQIALLCAVSWADFLGGLGAPDLVWGDHWWMQFWVGLSVSLLFGNVLFIRAVLDRRPGNTPPRCGVRYSLFWFASNADKSARTTSPTWATRVALGLVAAAVLWLIDWVTDGDVRTPLLTTFAATAVLLALWGQLKALVVHAAPADRAVVQTVQTEGQLDALAFRAAPNDKPVVRGPRVVRRVGAFLLRTWPAALALFYVPKMFAGSEFLRVETGFMPLGLVSGVLLTVAVVAVYEYWWRGWWIDSWLFKRLPAIASGAVPETDRPLHALAGLLTFLVPVFFLALLLYERAFLGAVWSPVWVICLMLALFNSLHGFLTFHLAGLQYVLLLLVALVVFVSNTGNTYKMSHPGLEPYADRPVVLDAPPPAPTDGQPLELIRTAELLKTFHETTWASRPRNGKPQGGKPKLVIVATTGGGIQAAVWTAVVLEKLEKDMPAFRDHIRLMTGASGGMQAAGLYAADFARYPRPEPNWLSDRLARDSLWPTVQEMLVHDLPRLGWPGRSDADRGRRLEKQWQDNTALWTHRGMPSGPPANWFQAASEDYRQAGRSPFERNFYEMRTDEAQCKQPVLVFSPMLVEDCRRVVISNLSMEWFAKTRVPHLNPRPPYEPMKPDDLISIPALEFWRYFPDAREKFTVGTAARMSATFPFVGPAVSLPTLPPRRVVDAGYFDNFGINMASMWLHHHRAEILAHTSGVVIVEIRAYPRREEKLRFALTNADGRPTAESFNWAVAESASPLEAVYNLYARSAYFRNDQLLHVLHEAFNARPDTRPERPFFTTVTFECNQPAALSWTLPERNYEEIRAIFDPDVIIRGASDEAKKQLARSRQQQAETVARLRDWFREGGTTGPLGVEP